MTKKIPVKMCMKFLIKQKTEQLVFEAFLNDLSNFLNFLNDFSNFFLNLNGSEGQDRPVTAFPGNE